MKYKEAVLFYDPETRRETSARMAQVGGGYNGYKSFCAAYDEADKLAKAAIEKQIAKKPIDQAELGIATYICGECPVCGAPCRNDGRFCYLCGQALDWSDAE